jgi:hypothetical protein
MTNTNSTSNVFLEGTGFGPWAQVRWSGRVMKGVAGGG